MPTALAEEQRNSSFDQFIDRYVDRDLLRFTTAGSVDDGKSTLIGRLLYDSKAVYQDQVQAIQKGRLNRSTGPMDFSLLTDGLRAEREQGITIDVAYRYFSTPRRKFIIADTPGHEQYTRNMATGASTADAAIVLVDARNGVLAQSRRHASIAALLGIPNIVAAVNKMDLVDYSEKVFRKLEHDMVELARQISSQVAYRGRKISIACIPISALEGDNVVTRSEKTPWYRGPSLLEHLEEIPLSDGEAGGPFRFPVQYVIRPDHRFRGFAGQIVGGIVRPGDRVLALPSRQTARVRSIVTFDGELEQAVAGSSVTLQLDDELDLSRGDVLVSNSDLPHVATRFVADVVWLHETPLELSKKWILRQATDELRVQARQIQARLNVNTMERHPAPRLGLNDIGTVGFEATRKFAFDLYVQNRNFGSFILVDPLTNATAGAGMITQIVSRDRKSDRFSMADHPAAVPSVAVSERSRRFGHYPAAVWLGTHQSLAVLLERALFQAGYQAIVVDNSRDLNGWNEALVKGLYSAGLIAVYAASDRGDEKKRRLFSAIPADRIFDLSAARFDPDGSLATEEALAWMERLRLGDDDGNSADGGEA